VTRLSILLLLAGCSSPPVGFDSPVPAERLRAATNAANTKDESAIPGLIRLLHSDDPVVRMAAIRSLERITGETRGYDHAAPEHERESAIQAWIDWQNARSRAP
jgi:HEAT repeat protein